MKRKWKGWKSRIAAGLAMLLTISMLEPAGTAYAAETLVRGGAVQTAETAEEEMKVTSEAGETEESAGAEESEAKEESKSEEGSGSETESGTVEGSENETESGASGESEAETEPETSEESEAEETSDAEKEEETDEDQVGSEEETTDTISGNQTDEEEVPEDTQEDILADKKTEAEPEWLYKAEIAKAGSIDPDLYCFQDENGVVYMAEDQETLKQIAGYSEPDYSAYTTDEPLPAPTGVHWNSSRPGELSWDAVSGSEGEYIIEIYKDGKLYHDVSFSGLEETGEVTVCECEKIEDSGTYRFRVKAGEWGVSGAWSAWSEEWNYEKPSAHLDTPDKLKWNKTTAEWDAVANADGYYLELYLNNKEFVVGFCGHGVQTQEDLFREMTEPGRYTFKVQALSRDITQTYHSALSAFSPAYDTGSVADQAQSALDEALDKVGGDPDGALQAVTDGIDVDNLAVAMQTDADVLSKVQELEQAYADAKNISVTTQTDSHVDEYVDASRIQVVGAALNAASNDKQMVMDFGKIDDEIDEEAYPYRMKNWVQFSIDLEGRTEGDKLLVPVRITIPIPKNIVPERFRILHYHQDGSYEEIDPVINGDGTASFTVTSFSPFVFGNELTPAESLSINKTDMALQKAGDTGTLTVTLTPAGANSNLIWTSSDESVAAVEDGRVTATGRGTAVIRVEAEENSRLCAECKVAVAGEEDGETGDIVYLSDLGLWMKNIDDQVYTGKNICPEIEIYDNGTLLTAKKDYTVAYKNNKNAGTASVMITGKGNYSGKGNGKKTADIKFSIVPKDISELTVSCEQCYATANKKQTPLPKIKDGSVTLKNKTDYVVTYTDAAGNPLEGNAIPKGASGYYRIVITGQKNYTGEIVRDIEVTGAERMLNKASVKFASGANKKAYKGGAAVTLSEKDLTVTLNKKKLVYGEDYVLEYQDNINAGKAKAVIVPAEGSSYAGSKEIAFTITGRALGKVKIEGFAAKLPYTGEEVIQSGMVLNDKAISKVLKENTDYTVTTTNNVQAGKATVVIQGIGGYTGTVKKTFTIAPRTITDQTVALEVAEDADNTIIRKTVNGREIWYISDALAYTKGGCRPVLNVSCNGETVEGKYAYKNADKITQDAQGGQNSALNKMPSLTFTAKGNYGGRITVYYGIHQADISVQNIQANDVVYNKKAGKFKSTPVITDAVTGKKLAAGSDYERTVEYTYADTEKAGEEVGAKTAPDAHTKIRVTVTGKGKYQGTASAVYKIIPASIAKATVKVKDQVYTGRECLPGEKDVTVKIGKATLAPGKDYEIVADGTDIINVGTRSFRIVGKGDNYGGTKTIKFKIKQKSFLWWFFR